MATEEQIIALRQMIEKSISRSVHTPADFAFLMGVISERCKETLGITTLKRIWGYIDGYDTTRYTTLSILARCIGFSDWDDFVANYQNNSESSNFVFGQTTDCEQLSLNSILTLTWAPDRKCTIRHKGNGDFTVTESINSKLKLNDTFHCKYIILGQPLYMDNFVRGNRTPSMFVIGNKGGITSVNIIKR